MTPEVIGIIDKLSSQLGVASDQVWNSYIAVANAQRIESSLLCGAGLLILFLSIFTILFCLFKGLLERDNERLLMLAIPSFFSGVIALIFLLNRITEAVLSFTNPEALATQMIIRAIGGI